MAQGLFIPDFRGAGTPGAPGVGSTRRGLETARQAEQLTQTQQIGLQGTSDQARIDSLVRGAVLLKQIQDPQQKLEFIRGRIQQLDENQIDSSDSRELLAIAESGDFAQVEELTDQAISLGQAPGKGFTLSPGQQRFGPGGGDPIAEVAPKPTGLSSLQQKVAAEGLDPNSPEGFKRAKELNQRAATDPSLKPTDQQVLAKANEGQLAAAGFANRVGAANENIDALIKDPTFDQTSISSAFFGAVPGGNFVLSDKQQQFIQAKRDFITAVLRKESGAAIGQDEFDKEEKKFFPQIGDKPGVLKQKASGRKRAFDNLRKQSKGVFDVQFKNPQIFENGGDLSQAEQTERGSIQQAATPEAAQPPATFNSTALGREISEQDIIDTLQANPGLTREQLLQQLGVQ